MRPKDRKPTRLKSYDYTQDGYYYVTLCTQDRVEWFGMIEDGKMILNGYGKIVSICWNDLPNHYANVKLDEYIIMPNHFHGIITIVGAGSPRPAPVTGAETAPLRTLGQVVAYFKYQSTKQMNVLRRTPGLQIWQRNYYERVIRDKTELHNARQYIQNNPSQWATDPENLAF